MSICASVSVLFKDLLIANRGLLYSLLPASYSSKFLELDLVVLISGFNGNQSLYLLFFDVFCANLVNRLPQRVSSVSNLASCKTSLQVLSYPYISLSDLFWTFYNSCIWYLVNWEWKVGAEYSKTDLIVETNTPRSLSHATSTLMDVKKETLVRRILLNFFEVGWSLDTRKTR